MADGLIRDLTEVRANAFPVVLRDAGAKPAKEAAETLDVWEAAHRGRVEKILAERGFTG